MPWSIEDPRLAYDTNLGGFLNILEAAKKHGIRRVVYASSSAVFGDGTGIPAQEGAEGECLSPYASSKFAQEIFAQSYSRCYGLELIGLRYFNVFGPRQDPNGAYAAVIPKWGALMASGRPCVIYGDGSSTRDYCHVSNVVEANFRAAGCNPIQKTFEGDGFCFALNIGCGSETSLLELHQMMVNAFEQQGIHAKEPQFMPPRPGDIEKSMADITRAQTVIGFVPGTSVSEGIDDLIGSGEFAAIR